MQRVSSLMALKLKEAGIKFDTIEMDYEYTPETGYVMYPSLEDLRKWVKTRGLELVFEKLLVNAAAEIIISLSSSLGRDNNG